MIPPKEPSTIASQPILYNKNILFYERSFYNTILTGKVINHIRLLLDTNGEMKPWSENLVSVKTVI